MPSLDRIVTESIVADENTAFSPVRLSESAPLLPSTRKKPFYRARPLWLVPFALVASLTRGMTLASRVEVFTQLACNTLHEHDHELYNHTLHINTTTSLLHPIHFSLDPAGPQLIPLHFPTSIHTDVYDDTDDDPRDDPRTIPSSKCVSDPAVQARAARTQTIMTTIMGALSALTTGWWGQFGERHGRTRVLAIATCGLFLTDLAFILVSTPHSPLSSHSHKLLIIAPILEGLSGGTSTLNGALTAYIADCTSPGSRARIFSRFSGVSFVGLAVGPIVGAFLIAHPLFVHPASVNGHPLQTVTSVFWVAITCSFVNLLLVLFVFPESLPLERRTAGAKSKAKAKSKAVVSDSKWTFAPMRLASSFLSPLGVFLPTSVPTPSNPSKSRQDWSLTFLALALLCQLLSSGVSQIKYLYAEHVYEWAAGQLSYYISLMGGVRALNLLLILPFIITTFKPVRSTQQHESSVSVSTSRTGTLPKPDLHLVASTSTSYAATTTTNAAPSALTTQGAGASSDNGNGKGKGKGTDTTNGTNNDNDKGKPKPTKNDLLQEMHFDLLLMRCSLFLDMLSHTLVVLAPLPPPSSLSSAAARVQEQEGGQGRGFLVSEALFVGATSLSSFGSGMVPAVQSLALCTLQARALARSQAKAKRRSSTGLSYDQVQDEQVYVDERGVRVEDNGNDNDNDEEGEGEEEEEIEPGKLFGALAVLQAVGQTILGPILFSLIYGTTVAWMPKAIFACAAGVLVVALALTGLVRPDVSVGVKRGGAAGRRGNGYGEVEAGMSGGSGNAGGKVKNGAGKRKAREERRGRSRVSKDLRGGAASMSESDSAEIQALYSRSRTDD